MPCHVPGTSVSSHRRRTLLSPSATVIVATLNLRKPIEREVHALIRRFSSGRWPLWRLLGMRREGLKLYVAVEWRRARRPDPYSVVEVSLRSIAFRWWYAPSETAARIALEQVAITASHRTSAAIALSIPRQGCRAIH
jgi:hypothetical protein